MVERMKMPRIQRAAQFAPFDALKGLHDALKLVEYNHERVLKSEISQEQIEKISENILNLEKNSTVKLEYFSDGHKKNYTGTIKVEIAKKQIKINNQTVLFDDILDLEIVEKTV